MKRICWQFPVFLFLLFQAFHQAAQAQVTDSSQTGEFIIRASSIDLFGDAVAENKGLVLPTAEPIQWQVYVPENYDPTKPIGLLVYISPTNSGEIRRDWKSLMGQFNLIWIAADNSGNFVDASLRQSYAYLAAVAMAQKYRIDAKRVYLSGFSGGGRIASIVAAQHPGIFKGAIYNCGVNFWGKNTEVALDQIRQNRYVFITGNRDFNRSDTRQVFRQYKAAGVAQIKYMEIPLMVHTNPSKNNYAKAIAWLDAVPSGAQK